MKKLAAALLLAALSAPAFAGITTVSSVDQPLLSLQSGHHKSYYICWYGDNGNLVSTEDMGGRMKLAPYDLRLTGHGGNHAWAYEIHSVNAGSCPSSVPNTF